VCTVGTADVQVLSVCTVGTADGQVEWWRSVVNYSSFFITSVKISKD
jgi:hypothetical protein